jgi:hypothetical protein
MHFATYGMPTLLNLSLKSIIQIDFLRGKRGLIFLPFFLESFLFVFLRENACKNTPNAVKYSCTLWRNFR